MKDTQRILLENQLSLFVKEFGNLDMLPYVKLAPVKGMFKKRIKPTKYSAFMVYTTDKPWETKECYVFVNAITEFNKINNVDIRSFSVSSSFSFDSGVRLCVDGVFCRDMQLQTRRADVEYLSYCADPANGVPEHTTDITFTVLNGTMPEDPDTIEYYSYGTNAVAEILSLIPTDKANEYIATIYITHTEQPERDIE